MLSTLFAFIVALGLLVTFHELGHYLVARWCGVRVLRFSVGFGRVVLRRTDRRGTEWAVSAIPLGGYVKMLDEPEEPSNPDEVAAAFVYKPLWQRSAIVAAGPLANLLLAVILYAGLNLVGVQEPAAILAKPESSSPAAMAGLQGGETVVAVDGTEVSSWSQMRWELLDTLTGGGVAVLHATNEQGASTDYELSIQSWGSQTDQNDALQQTGLILQTPAPTVAEVLEDSAGEQAGLKGGDVVIAIDDQQHPSAAQVVDLIRTHAGQTLPLVVQRDGNEIQLEITPEAHADEQGQTAGRLGVMLSATPQMVNVRYGPLESLWRGVTRTGDTTALSFRMLGRMVTGDVSMRHISGPVTIADYAGQTARAGWVSYVAFLALISISIGVLNLLPIPMLDGGHLLFYLLEALRGGRPVPEKWQQQGQRVGLALLAALMVIAFFNDFSRLFSQ